MENILCPLEVSRKFYKRCRASASISHGQKQGKLFENDHDLERNEPLWLKDFGRFHTLLLFFLLMWLKKISAQQKP